jgi:hypothetical protein
MYKQHFPPVITAFHHAETSKMTISAARGRGRRELISLFNSLTSAWYSLAIEIFHVSLTCQNLFDILDLP